MTTFTQYNFCANDYYNESGKCTIELYNGEITALNEKCNKYIKVDGCSDSSKLNMTINDYSLMMGISSNLLGFSLVLGVILIFTRR